MEAEIPAKAILDIYDFIKDLSRKSYPMYVIMAGRIRQVQEDNKVRHMTINDKILRLQKEFFEFEEFTPEGSKDKQERIKKFTPPPTPGKEAVYEKKIIRKKSWFQKEISENVLVSPEVKEQHHQPEPVMKEGKTMEEFDLRFNQIMNEKVRFKF